MFPSYMERCSYDHNETVAEIGLFIKQDDTDGQRTRQALGGLPSYTGCHS